MLAFTHHDLVQDASFDEQLVAVAVQSSTKGSTRSGSLMLLKPIWLRVVLEIRPLTGRTASCFVHLSIFPLLPISQPSDGSCVRSQATTEAEELGENRRNPAAALDVAILYGVGV